MDVKQIEQRISNLKKEMDDWKGLNRHIFKKKQYEIDKLQKQIIQLNDKPKKVKKVKKVKKSKKKYKTSDVNKDGKIDFNDIVTVAKDMLKHKKKK